MFRVLFLMIALLAGLVAGPYLSGQQGYVRIETANNIIEMSITTLVIFFVIALAIIYGLEWIITRFYVYVEDLTTGFHAVNVLEHKNKPLKVWLK